MPTSTPAPTPTSLPTSTPLPTLSPEDAAATEALVPGWIELQYGLVEFLLELKLNHPEASALFESMAWVQDHIGNSDYDLLLAEVGTATRLRELWRVGPLGQEMFLALLCKPWMQDDLSINESGLIDGLAQVFEREPDGAMGLLDMPFLDTTEEAVESRIVDLLSNLLYYFTDLRELLFRPEFSDGITDDHVTTLVLMYYETQEPEAVALMEALPWIQDGADASELEEVERLMRLAWASDLFFRAAMDTPWVRDGLSPDEHIFLEFFSRDWWTLGREDPDSVAAIEALPWVQDGVDEPEWSRAQALMRLGLASSQVLEVVVNRSWTQDGLSPDEASTIGFLTEALRFPTSDGQVESEVLGLLDMPWMQDSISFEESKVVESLSDVFVLRMNSGLARRLLQMPFLESVDGEHESRIVDYIRSMTFPDTSAVQRLLSSPEFAGGITDDHAPEIALIRLERFEPEAVAEIRALPWVQDGTNLSDWDHVTGLIYLAWTSDLFFRAAVDSTWVRDGLSPDELTSINSMYWAWLRLEQADSDAVAAVDELPWLLDSVNRLEWDGALALIDLGLSDITAFWSAIESDWVQDGISADEVGMISSLG